MNPTATAKQALQNLPGYKTSGKNQFEARCPAHEDRKASLSIGFGDDGKILLDCKAGCKTNDILTALGLSMKDLFPQNGNGHKQEFNIVAAYDYRTAAGELSYQVVRLDPKDFRQRRPDGQGGWTWGTKGLKRLPYNLSQIAGAEYIWVVEGEKDAEAIRTIGQTATCNTGGAGKWTEELNQYFTPHHHITILPDNDTPGRDHALQVAQHLLGKVASIKILALDGLPEKGDVSDWLQGRDPEAASEELCRLADAAPEWKPEEKPSIIHWAAEALAPQPAKEYIVKDLIGVGDVVTVVGDAGSKKTFATIDLAVCVGLGKEWLGRRVLRSRVLIVDEESGDTRLKIRLGDCMRAHEAGPDLPVAFTTLAGITLTTDEGANYLSQIIEETQARLVLMDALQDFTLGLDENSGKELSPAIHRLRKIAEKQECAIWIIHHINKQGGYRGHSSIKGLVDVMLKCESATDSPLVQFTAEKSRDFLIKPFAATAHFDLSRFWLTDAEPKAEGDARSRPERYVREFMQKQPDKTAKMGDITNHADICSADSARHAVYDLVTRGQMERIDAGGRGVAAVYHWTGL